ncbi:Stp1/IreP family PP2C-type Ser/Thr phosphatase [Sulfuricella sp.]|uniref:Stp1/IreP family PP2C-type Ser/Thr phosphatase n=1 Tax=Sulfuricella sp. TaxID=2099377 RepID=UPI002C9C360F|nr:Stp1/IreP family PP2C-type Ser/Thr phosphatase [Sulfuricella sp.]HUX62995.1 Stp1/IreP family PP2C-type Ser/Thr phosphatase [Sulfuricella sp.]
MDLRLALEIVSLTDPGKVRSHNEDSIATDNEAGFAILADGMGGYNGGEVASGIAVTMLADGLKKALHAGLPEQGPGLLVKSEIEKTNGAIYQTAQSQPQFSGMGTTLVCALFHDNHITVAHVGDSRLYRYRQKEPDQTQFEQITRDHSLLQEQIDSGMISREDARLSNNKNLVTRALGVDPTVNVEVQEHEALPGDVYLLCSDGLNDMVGDEEIQLTLSVLGTNLELAAQRLVQMANDNGGRDNVSVILVRILHSFPARRGIFAWLSAWRKK